MNHIIQYPSFMGALALNRAQGTHLMVTHSSLDHRGQTLCARYRPLVPVMDTQVFAGWLVRWVEWGLGWRCVLPCKVSSICSDAVQWEGQICLTCDWGMTLNGSLPFCRESEINTELLMFAPSIDLSAFHFGVLCSLSLSLCFPD